MPNEQSKFAAVVRSAVGYGIGIFSYVFGIMTMIGGALVGDFASIFLGLMLLFLILPAHFIVHPAFRVGFENKIINGLFLFYCYIQLYPVVAFIFFMLGFKRFDTQIYPGSTAKPKKGKGSHVTVRALLGIVVIALGMMILIFNIGDMFKDIIPGVIAFIFILNLSVFLGGLVAGRRYMPNFKSLFSDGIMYSIGCLLVYFIFGIQSYIRGLRGKISSYDDDYSYDDGTSGSGISAFKRRVKDICHANEGWIRGSAYLRGELTYITPSFSGHKIHLKVRVDVTLNSFTESELDLAIADRDRFFEDVNDHIENVWGDISAALDSAEGDDLCGDWNFTHKIDAYINGKHVS